MAGVIYPSKGMVRWRIKTTRWSRHSLGQGLLCLGQIKARPKRTSPQPRMPEVETTDY